MGECCLAMLRLDGEPAVPFVVQFLASDSPDIRVQAAIALGESRLPGTLDPLRQAHEREREPAVRESLLICIGLLRSSAATDFLISLIGRGDATSATDAIRALAPYGKSAELRDRIEAAVQRSGEPSLRAIFEKAWSR
jgi:HEAT repeat protein